MQTAFCLPKNTKGLDEMGTNTTSRLTFTCGRPTLASELIAAGYTAETKVSPWDEKKTLWLFDLDEKAVAIIRRHYVRANKPLPKVITDFLKRRTLPAQHQIEVR